jgi:hypothetical protein
LSGMRSMLIFLRALTILAVIGILTMLYEGLHRPVRTLKMGALLTEKDT